MLYELLREWFFKGIDHIIESLKKEDHGDLKEVFQEKWDEYYQTKIPRCGRCCSDSVCEVYRSVRKIVGDKYYHIIDERYEFINMLAFFCRKYKKESGDE